MLTLPPQHPEAAVLLFGMECSLTSRVLQGLMSSNVRISAVILPGPAHMETPIRVAPPSRQLTTVATTSVHRSVAALASSASLPVFRVGNLASHNSLDMFASFDNASILSVCFPRRIPTAFLESRHRPVLNVHPSMLPELRGPDPLFWTFHRGDGTAGLSIHLMNARFDAGPIVVQEHLRYPDGSTEHELEDILAARTVRMVSELAAALADGRIEATDQCHVNATWARFPEDPDYIIDPTWTTRRARNFVSGISGRGNPVMYRDGLTSVSVRTLRPFAGDRSALVPGDQVQLLEFADGYAIAEIMPPKG